MTNNLNYNKTLSMVGKKIAEGTMKTWSPIKTLIHIISQ